jgi:hypothetical protein
MSNSANRSANSRMTACGGQGWGARRTIGKLYCMSRVCSIGMQFGKFIMHRDFESV